MGWGIPLGTSLLVLLNASCHKKHEYIWFMGGDLNSFYKMNRVGGGGGHAWAHRGGGPSPHQYAGTPRRGGLPHQ